MSKFQIGEKVEFHTNHNYETNCAICAKPLGANFKEILIGDGNILLTADQYEESSVNGGFVYTAPIGSSCVKDFPAEVVA
jgi:hypothetical protein